MTAFVTVMRAGMEIVFYLWLPAMNGIKGINPGFHKKKKKTSTLSLSCFNPWRIVVPSCEIMIPARWVAGVGQRRGGTSSGETRGRRKRKKGGVAKIAAPQRSELKGEERRKCRVANCRQGSPRLKASLLPVRLLRGPEDSSPRV